MTTLSPSEIRRYYEARVPNLKLTDAREWRGACPIHNGQRDSFSVNSETGAWYCHSGCARGGSIFDLETELTGINGTEAFKAVLRIIGREAEPKRRIVACYDYLDEQGNLLFQTVRFDPKDFSQRQPDGKGDWIWNLKGVRRVLYRLPQVLAASTVYVVEGERDANALVNLGVEATTAPMGAGKWRSEYAECLRGKTVYVLPDADAPGAAHAADIFRSLRGVAESVALIELPNAKDPSEWIARGGTLAELKGFALCADPEDVASFIDNPTESAVCGATPPTPAAATISRTLAQVHEVFMRWLHLPDPGIVTLALAAVAANRMEGDPVWMLLIGPPSSGKTEILDSFLTLPDMHPAGTLTEAALLSGVAKKEHAANAKGGLLRAIGDFGFLVLKDFTSTLSMGREARSLLLAALREIHDGAWTRHFGTDGGKELRWKGKCALIGGCTPVIDEHHGVMAAMGERFLLCRLPDIDDAQKQAHQALEHVGKEVQMRTEMREAVSGLLGALEARSFHLDDGTRDRLSALATFTARARSAVIRDGYRREVELIPGAERPARLVLALARLLHGMRVIGAEEKEAWRLIVATALDCLPQIRRRVFEFLYPDKHASTTEAAVSIEYPTITTRRALEDLAAHGIVTRSSKGPGHPDEWELSLFCRNLVGADTPFSEMLKKVKSAGEEG